MPRGVYQRSPQHKQKLREQLAVNVANGEPGTYVRTEEHRAAFALRRKSFVIRRGSDNPRWKGDAVGYGGIHSWMTKEFGRPSKCEDCGTEKATTYDWANVSGTYLRDRSDWIRLCRSCHMKSENRGYKNVLFIEFGNEKLPLKQWAIKLGIKYQTLYNRLFDYEWPVERAFTEGVGR